MNSMSTANEPLLWKIRTFIYDHFAETTQPPNVEETANQFSIDVSQTYSIYKRLHEHHAIILEPNSFSIRMANPFSGIPTDFKVLAKGKTYYATCAWDMLGIPSALQVDAAIEAVCTDTRDLIHLDVRNGQISLSQAKINFPLPFSRWYEDLIFT